MLSYQPFLSIVRRYEDASLILYQMGISPPPGGARKGKRRSPKGKNLMVRRLSLSLVGCDWVTNADRSREARLSIIHRSRENKVVAAATCVSFGMPPCTDNHRCLYRGAAA